MKKILMTVLCLFLMAVLSMNVFAAEAGMSASADKSSISAGQSVVITVSIDSLDNCKSGSLKISYDTSLFTRSHNEWLLSGTAIADPEGDAVFAYSTPKAISGQIYRFTLTAKEDADLKSSDIKLSMTLKTADGATTSENATVKITISCPHSYSNACDTSCDLCGKEREITHTWDSGKVTKEPTCTTQGVKTCTCTVCGATKEEKTDVAGHSYDKGTVTKEPGCNFEGEKTFTCTACGTTKTETIEENGHSYDDGVVSKEASCSEDGEKTITCSVCNKVKTETIPKTDHNYDHDCDTNCNVCGATREITHSLAWDGNATEHWYQCTVCGHVELEDGHTCPTEMSYNAEVHGYLCTACGIYVDAEAHIFDNDCDTSCDTCGYLRSTEHTYMDNWTYSHEGHWYECISCGDKLEIQPHVPGDEATATTDQICLVCGYIIQVAENHEHSMGGDWLSDADNHWFQCNCGVYVAPIPHAWDEGVIDEDRMVVTYTCSDCGYLRMEEYVPPTQAPTDPTETTDPEDPTDSNDPTAGTDPQKPGFMEDPDWLDLNIDLNLGFTIQLWMILAICLVISIGFNIFFLVCLFSNRKTGKYVRQPVFEDIPNEAIPELTEAPAENEEPTEEITEE